jgi:hypothetical protein
VKPMKRHDWSDESVVVREQPAISVYRNKFGDVVVRQQSWYDDDPCIIIQLQNAADVARAILEEAGFDSSVLFRNPAESNSESRSEINGHEVVGKSEIARRPKDKTGADRQRRFRVRRRNAAAAVTPSVTAIPPDTVTADRLNAPSLPFGAE